MLSEQLKEELELIIELPGECGRKCNAFLPHHGGKALTSRKGSIIGGLLLGPAGMIAGGQRALNSVHSLCRAKCKLDKTNKSTYHELVKQKLQTARAFSSKVNDPKVLNSLINKVMSYKF